jgi:hypothetical protein
VAPWLLLQCGDSDDLIIGLLEPSSEQPDASSSGGSSPLPDADPDVPSVGGSSGTGGTPVGGSAGETAAGGGGEGNVVIGPCEAGDVPPAGSLIHRWDFSGPGLVAIDSISGANGDIISPDETLDDGVLAFNGQGESYVNLPDRIVSVLEDATLVAWTTWNGGAAWQRVFDFGMSTEGEDMRGRGVDFFMLANMPSESNASEFGFMQLEFSPQPDVDEIVTSQDLPNDVEHQYAVTVRSAELIELYIDGQLAGSLPISASLSDVDDLNAWFGLSNTDTDASYNGVFNEFRIYDEALSSCAVQSLYDAGPDVLP